MKTYVIYFEDGSYFKCWADSELDAIIRAEIELRYEINRNEVKILSY